MKEKIKIIFLLVLFIVLLILCNNILKHQQENSNKIIDDTDNIIDINNSLELNESNDLIQENNNLEENNMNGNVFEVTSENFEKEVLESDKTVLIDFYAEWCGPCKMLSPIVEAVAAEETNIKFVKMNVDNCEDIAIKYQVMSIPTLVVIKDGKEVNRSVGLIDKTRIKELIK